MVEEEHPGDGVEPPVFRVDETTPKVVQSVLLEHGWNEFDKGTWDAEDEDWNLYWRASPFPMVEHANLKPWQQLNHHPRTAKLTRKDDLAKLLKYMKGVYGASLYEFIPLTFIMPNDYHKFVAEYSKERQMFGTKPGYWICKPAELSCGRGILIFNDIEDLVFHDTYVVQKYICNPLLVGKYKCNLRIYVCVTGFKPLTIYIYQKGLVRFATEKFDLSNLQNNYAHLTNSSLNKLGASYEKFEDVIGRGCKWTLSRFFSYLCSSDVDDLLLWQKINCVVILTVLTIAPSVPCAANCFELFGFDVLIDDNLKPWLLEVNFSPDLSLHCSTDVSVKRKLIHDVIRLVHLTGPRNQGKGCGRAPQGDASISFANIDRGGLSNVYSSPPYWSFLQVTGRVFTKDEPTMEKGERTCSKNTQTSPLREQTNKQDVLLATREPPKTEPKLTSKHTPRKPFVPYRPRIQAHGCKTSFSPGLQPDSSQEPKPHASRRTPARRASPWVSSQTAARSPSPRQATSFSFSLSMRLLLELPGMD